MLNISVYYLLYFKKSKNDLNKQTAWFNKKGDIKGVC